MRAVGKRGKMGGTRVASNATVSGNPMRWQGTTKVISERESLKNSIDKISAGFIGLREAKPVFELVKINHFLTSHIAGM